MFLAFDNALRMRRMTTSVQTTSHPKPTNAQTNNVQKLALTLLYTSAAAAEARESWRPAEASSVRRHQATVHHGQQVGVLKRGRDALLVRQLLVHRSLSGVRAWRHTDVHLLGHQN